MQIASTPSVTPFPLTYSSPSNSHVDNLMFLYCQTEYVTAKKNSDDMGNIDENDFPLKEKVSTIDDNEEREKKFAAYFYKLTEEITDKIDSVRQIQKGNYQKPPTFSDSAFHFFVALLGIFNPAAGIIAHEVHKHLKPVIEHAVHFAKEGLELIDRGRHVYHAYHYRHYPENNYKSGSDLKGKQLNYFIDKLAAELTYRFRHEILTLNKKECSELVSRHFNQIIDCYSKIKNKELVDADQLFSEVMDYIDPDSMKEVKNRIYEYNEKRKARVFKNFSDSLNYCFADNVMGKREEFFSKFSRKLNTKGIEELIHKISSNLIFREQGLIWSGLGSINSENPTLGLSNPYLKKMNLSFEEDKNKKNHVYKNPYAFAPLYFSIPNFTSSLNFPDRFYFFHNYISMKSVAEKIILLLQRCLIVEVVNSLENEERSEKDRTIIQDLTTPESKKIHKVLRKVDFIAVQQNNLVVRVDNQDERINKMQEQFDRFMASQAI